MQKHSTHFYRSITMGDYYWLDLQPGELFSYEGVIGLCLERKTNPQPREPNGILVMTEGVVLEVDYNNYPNYPKRFYLWEKIA